MRALFALAALLGTTVAALASGLSAQEFNRWKVWMECEQQGPEWAALHRAQLLAATHNAGLFKRHDGNAFTAADFERPDPWAPSAGELPAAQLKAKLAAEYARMMKDMGA